MLYAQRHVRSYSLVSRGFELSGLFSIYNWLYYSSIVTIVYIFYTTRSFKIFVISCLYNISSIV